MAAQPAALLVHDDPNLGSDVRRALAERPMHLDVASDADAALVLLDANRYDGIVLDRASTSAVLMHLDRRCIHVPVVVTASELPHDVACDEVRLLLPRECETSLLACAILGLCGIES